MTCVRGTFFRESSSLFRPRLRHGREDEMFDLNQDIMKQAHDRVRAVSADLEIRQTNLAQTPIHTLDEMYLAAGPSLLAAAIQATQNLLAALEHESVRHKESRDSTIP